MLSEMARKSIPQDTETAVLILSGRRCALCFGLDQDFDKKRGQIAHVDRSADNNALENLAFLCMMHHDEYDCRTSQSKGFTPAELKLYRQELYTFLDERIPHRTARFGEYSVYEHLIPLRWRHIYESALSFHTCPHRMQAAVLSLLDGPKTAAAINEGIPPKDLAWTTAIINDALQRGWIERAEGDRYRLGLEAKVILEALAEIPEAVKEHAWRRNWFPDSAETYGRD